MTLSWRTPLGKGLGTREGGTGTAVPQQSVSETRMGGGASRSQAPACALSKEVETSRAEAYRLADEVQRLKKAKADASSADARAPDTGADAAEVDMLTSENAVFSKALDTLQQEVTRLKTENEKLKGELKTKQTDLARVMTEANSLQLQLRAMRKQPGPVSTGESSTPPPMSSSLDSQLFSYQLDEKDLSKLRQIQRRTHFHEVTTERLFDVFKNNAGESSCLDQRQFLAAITELGTVPAAQTFIFARFYTLFDRNGDEKVDFGEFAGGLSVLCAGTMQEKLQLIFTSMDADGSGYLTRDELAIFVTNLLVVSKGIKAGSRLNEAEMKQLDEQCRAEIDAIFDMVDKDHDGKLSYEEFDSGAESTALKGILSIFMSVSVDRIDGAHEEEEGVQEETVEECSQQ